MAEKKNGRSKHVSYPAQREQCRLNKHTYIEKCGTCGQKHLMCNYPFPQPDHKKGFCKAVTCTDMRTIPEEIVEADEEEKGVEDEGITHKVEPGDDLTDELMDEAAGSEAEKTYVAGGIDQPDSA